MILARSMCLRSWRLSRAEATEFEHNLDAAYGVMYISLVPLKTIFLRIIFELWEISHVFSARNFAHLYAVRGRQHSMDTVAKCIEQIYGMVM